MQKRKKKIPALTEFGYGQVPVADWWTNTFWKGIEGHAISFVLAWRNAGRKKDGSMEFYVPYPVQLSAADFVRFYENNKTLFQQEATRAQLYSN